MALPPAPEKASMRMGLEAGAESHRWVAILLRPLLPVKVVPGFSGGALCDGLGSHTEPGIVRHPDAIVVLGEDLVALGKVTIRTVRTAVSRALLVVVSFALTSGCPRAPLPCGDSGGLPGDALRCLNLPLQRYKKQIRPSSCERRERSYPS